MIFIDATKGLSGDMLLAAMIGLLDASDRRGVAERLESAAVAHSFECELVEVEDRGDKGLALSCTQTEPTVHGVSYDECFLMLTHMEEHLGAGSGVGKAILQLLFEAEGKAHNLPPKEVHLHEIGRPQAILNIAAIGVLASRLERNEPKAFVSSTIVTGRGIVVMSHGAVRVPPPVSEVLLRGMKHAPGEAPGERATPTGIAAVKVLASSYSDSAPEKTLRRSVGFGVKRFAGELGRTTLSMA